MNKRKTSPYIFHRGDMWYPIELYDDADARENADGNPGTTKVVNAVTQKIVWEIRDYLNMLHPDPEWDQVFTVKEWAHLKNNGFSNNDGSGYWMKDGFISNDEVFHSEPQDATHVIWYSK